MRGFGTGLAAAAMLFCGLGAANAQFKVLYNFGPGTGDGPHSPSSGLIPDGKGNFYGVTSGGGEYAAPNNPGGAVYELSPAPDGKWTVTVLYSFGGRLTDAVMPQGNLALDSKGNLYGVAAATGNCSDCASVFKLTPGAGGEWSMSDSRSFGSSAQTGLVPQGPVAVDSKGNLYGVTNTGTVFQLLPRSGGGWEHKALHSLGSAPDDETQPRAGLILDGNGNLFGTTANGGKHGKGTVYELSPASSGNWSEKVLYSFGEQPGDGNQPWSSVVFDSNGNLYGTTAYGGAFDKTGASGGTVYELVPGTDGEWTEKVLASFEPAGPAGSGMFTGVAIDADGNLYGTTSHGGTNGAGTIFEIEAAPAVATPVISPAGGAVAAGQTVKITDSSTGATLYYTTTGETPTASSEKYTDPIVVRESETIKAIAINAKNGKSAVATEVFTVEKRTATPMFSVKAGTYELAQTVKISDATPGSTVYYTTNGKTPTTASTKYTAAIKVASSETIEAIAVAKGFLASNLATAAYKIVKPAATPVLSAKPDSVMTTNQSVTITDSTPGSTIYYTTDGKAPTKSSTRYTKPIPIAATETIEAIAVANGYSESAVASAHYTFGPLNLDYAALPGGPDGGVVVPVGGTGGMTVIPINETAQPLTGITATVSTGSVKLPLTIAMCLASSATGTSSNCPSGSSTTLTLPSIAPGEDTSKIVLIQVKSSGTIASSPANKITVSFKNSSGTLLASAVFPVTSTAAPPVDVIIVSSTGNNLQVPVNGSAAFAVAAELDTTKPMSSVTVAAVTSVNLPVSIGVCQTNPQTAQCLSAPQPSVTVGTFSPGSAGSLTFSVFVTASAAIANSPANQIKVVFQDLNGNPIGSASIPIFTTN